jgi:hypothetical protein
MDAVENLYLSPYAPFSISSVEWAPFGGYPLELAACKVRTV